MFIVFIFLITLATSEDPREFFYLFLFSFLIGISTARMSVVGMVRGGNENIFNYKWFMGIILSALVVVGLSSLFGEVFADKFGLLGGIFTGIFGSLLIVLWVIFNPVISLLITLLSNLFNDSQVIKDLGNSLQNLNNLMRGLEQKVSSMIEHSRLGSILLQWAPVLKTIFLVIIILLIIVGIVLWLSIRLWSDRERRRVGDEKKSMIRSGNLLYNILDKFLQSWKKTLNSIEQMTDLRKRQRIRTAARIRQIYADLMDICDSLGKPRLEAQTPLEFISVLINLFPDYQSEIDMITNAYLDVRYGLLPENPRAVAEIEVAWKRLHTSASKLIKERKQLNQKKKK
jgi:hypothetical protein